MIFLILLFFNYISHYKMSCLTRKPDQFWSMFPKMKIMFVLSVLVTRSKVLSHLNHKQVLKFTQQQKTLVATMRRFSVMKKESSITRDIKLQAESLHRRLDALSKQVQRTEDQQGPTAVTTRIQRSQHAALHRKFQQVSNIIYNFPLDI